jgi:serine protease Do
MFLKGITKMKLNQSIARAIIALVLVLTTLFSASSCVLLNPEVLEEFFNQQFGDIGQIPENQNPDLNPDNNTQTGNQNNNVIPEFHPESKPGDESNATALQKTLLSTVLIYAQFGDSVSIGSGVIYQIDKKNGDAYIVTNQHVVFSAESGASTNISIYLYGMVLGTYAITAKYIGGTTTYDIAVLKIEGSEILKNSLAVAAPLGKSADVRLFDTVYAVGNPEAYGFSATKGMVSVRSETTSFIGAENEAVSVRVIRIDAPVNHGNSGGGVYNDNGQLIGILVAKTPGEDVEGLGYAIPVDLVKNLADNLLFHCNGTTMIKLNRALMGITISSGVIGPVVDENGCLVERQKVEVQSVSLTSLAFGKVRVGDIVNSITVDGVKAIATEVYVVSEHMLNARVGSTVVLNVTRGTETFDITFTITKNAITLEK